jgi:hypothetical protein
MRAQRPAHLAPAIRALAEELPLDDGAVDASMALVTVHQWRDLARGLRELRRVTRGPIVVLTFDVEKRRYPALSAIGQGLGGAIEVKTIPIPNDCLDGFTEAYYGRPEQLLDPLVRRSQSAWSFVSDGRSTTSGKAGPQGWLGAPLTRCAGAGVKRMAAQGSGQVLSCLCPTLPVVGRRHGAFQDSFRWVWGEG